MSKNLPPPLRLLPKALHNKFEWKIGLNLTISPYIQTHKKFFCEQTRSEQKNFNRRGEKTWLKAVILVDHN